MSESESISQDVVTRAPFPLTVGTILDFAEALKDRPRDERIDYVKMGALGSSYLRHKRPAVELPPTSVPETVEPENVRELRTAMIATEAIRLARDGQKVLALFESQAVMHAWFDYEVKLLEQQGGTNFRVYRDRPGFWSVRFREHSSSTETGAALFGIVGATYTQRYDTVLTDARVRSV
ncbi:hypothetical protein SEA_JFLIX2_85 [Rhodococcus phage Jflix2]|nr:hypothetical protein SEA_JFLIX2_85 [Rhodococcus phage Jflix2]